MKNARVIRRREYVYVDELGAPLFRAVRTDLDDGNKGFWQERYEAGKWIAGLSTSPTTSGGTWVMTP